MLIKNKHLKKGFTIVELLIVIVVIAILAAITIVSYNGIARTAVESAMKQDLNSAARKLQLDKTETGSFVLDTDETKKNKLLVFSEGTVPQYTSDGKTFCLTIYSTRQSGLVFSINQEGILKVQPCAGHTSGPIVATNPTCFRFDAASKAITGYYTNEGNDSSKPTCPRDVVIPSEINNTGVTVIGFNAFSSKNLTSVTIPKSITWIDENAFESNNLTSLTIPNSVTWIGGNAFGNNSLTSVVVPSSVTKIANMTFANNKLNSIVLPNSLTAIGESAFSNNLLTTVVIPASVTKIENWTFASNSLTSVTMPGSIIMIGEYAFSRNELTAIAIPDSVTTIKKSAFYANKLTSVTLPPSITTMGLDVFLHNPSTSSAGITCRVPNGSSFPSSSGCQIITYY